MVLEDETSVSALGYAVLLVVTAKVTDCMRASDGGWETAKIEDDGDGGPLWGVGSNMSYHLTLRVNYVVSQMSARGPIAGVSYSNPVKAPARSSS